MFSPQTLLSFQGQLRFWALCPHADPTAALGTPAPPTNAQSWAYEGGLWEEDRGSRHPIPSLLGLMTSFGVSFSNAHAGAGLQGNWQSMEPRASLTSARPWSRGTEQR